MSCALEHAAAIDSMIGDNASVSLRSAVGVEIGGEAGHRHAGGEEEQADPVVPGRLRDQADGVGGDGAPWLRN
jgi:hypothetical protein